MPTYRYRCGSCGTTEEKAAPMDAIPRTLHCDKCDQEMTRDYTAEKAYAAFHPTKGSGR